MVLIMLSLNMLQHGLSDYIIGKPIPNNQKFLNYCVLEHPDLPDDPTKLCLSTPTELIYVLDHLPPQKLEQFTFVVAGYSPALRPYLDRENLTILQVNLGLAQLLNKIIDMEHAYDAWTFDMNKSLYIDTSLPSIVASAARISQSDCLLLDMTFQITVCARVIDCPFLREYEEGNVIADTPICTNNTPDWVEREEWAMRLIPIFVHGELACYLLIAVLAERRTPFIEDLYHKLSRYVTAYVERFQSGGGDGMTAFLCRILDGKLTDSEEILRQAKKLRMQLLRYYRVIVIASQRGNERLSPFFAQGLHLIFPNSIIFSYQNHIVILTQSESYSNSFSFDSERLVALLKQYQCVACIGGQTKWLASLRPLYVQAKGVLKYFDVFSNDPDCRIWFYEDFAIYQTMELCAAYCQDYFHNDVLYLCHPGTVSLWNCDTANGTNYCDILEYYLNHNCNLTLTAKALHFHRNTLYNKLKKIEEILDCDIQNPSLHLRILFSLTFLRYVRLYMKRTDFYAHRRRVPSTAELLRDDTEKPRQRTDGQPG